jgi:hypothetical protein
MNRSAQEGSHGGPRMVKCLVLSGICLTVGDRYPGDVVVLYEEKARPLLQRGVLVLQRDSEVS